LGGVDLPALGFGMGDVVIGELLRSRGLIPETPARTDFWVAGEDDGLTPEVMSVAAQLRQRDKSVEYSLKPQQLSRQLKSAAAAGASHAVLLKHDRFAAGEVTVRDLQAGTEQTIPLTEFINSL
ncbi:MAG TPA: His/Gly/Thr/Pro-type tRNA ligase C-terminal domain-containing protein, partial [Gemmatimonadaceae bacterium]|nr:His/Gly/Thr/Pro-type tRNA ligase C-terminal domain-containing protein [Gemmatimonadaceae bacterium]